MNDEMQKQLMWLSEVDVKTLVDKGKDYGDSWKRRGGVGAFMMLARKWDRLEGQVQKEPKWDVFEHGTNDTRTEGILDDLSDLRRYLLLVEAEIRNRRAVARTRQSPDLGYPGPVVGPQAGPVEFRGLKYRVNVDPSWVQIYPDSVQIVPHVHTDKTGQGNPFGYDPYEDSRPAPGVGGGGVSGVPGVDCDGVRNGSRK